MISVKAETHNFPTTVEPFNGAATGTGGEIRDRIAGGKGAFPVAGPAAYMTAYPRLDGGREWEKATEPREWLYQTPEDILIKASNGASDFGNKFGPVSYTHLMEEATSREAAYAAVDEGLKPFAHLLRREITLDDVVKLTELRMIRISRYDSFKADEHVKSVEQEIAQVKRHLACLLYTSRAVAHVA